MCEDFSSAVQEYAVDVPVCLFLARLPRRISVEALRAAKRRESFVDVQLRINEFMPVVAVLWPIEKAREFRQWAAEGRMSGPKPHRSDDAVAGRWACTTKQRIRFSVPSLVQHPDEVPSLIGRTPSWGRDSGRVAVLFRSL